ncbi:MAG: hypothetical protein R3B54_18480 [Bdellovibrionota bacterium]
MKEVIIAIGPGRGPILVLCVSSDGNAALNFDAPANTAARKLISVSG